MDADRGAILVTGGAGYIGSHAAKALVGAGRRVVAVLTGHGLKDPDTAIRGAETPATIAPRIDDLLGLLSL